MTLQNHFYFYYVPIFFILVIFLGWHIWRQIDAAGKRSRQNIERAPNLTIKSKTYLIFLAFIFTLLTLGLMTSSYSAYQNYKKQLLVQAEHQLSVIASVKADALQNWRMERLEDANLFYDNRYFSEQTEAYFKNPKDDEARSNLLLWLKKMEAGAEYERLFLLDANQVERLALPARAKPGAATLAVAEQASASLAAHEIIFWDFHKQPETDAIRLSILVPIFSAQNKQALGTLVLEIDPNHHLYPILQNNPTPSQSAETLLVRREGKEALCLNPLRFQTDAALTLRTALTENQIPEALFDRQGIQEGLDYRKVQVFADTRAVAGSPWFLVSKIDSAEVNATLPAHLLKIILFLVTFILAAVTGHMLIWRQQQMQYDEIQLAARQSEEKFGKILDVSPMAISIARLKDGVFIFINDNFERMSGYAKAEVIAKTAKDLNFWKSAETHQKLVEDLKKQGDHRNYETTIQTRTGEIYCLVSAVIIQIHDEPHILTMVIDITRRKQAEVALRESEERFRQIYEHMAIGVARLSLDFRIQSANQAYCRMLGYSEQELINKHLREITHPESLEENVIKQTQLAGGDINSYRMEKCFIHKEGHSLYGIIDANLVRDEQGNPSYFLGSVLNITERKQAEEKAMQAERRFRSLIEHAPDGIILIGMDGKYKYASPSSAKIFNYTMEEILNSEPAEGVHPEDLTMVLQTLQDIIQKPLKVRTLQYRMKQANGTWLWLEGIFTNLQAEPSVEAIVVNFRDITERKKTDEKLRESEERSRMAHDAAQLGTWYENLNTQIFHLDERARHHYDQDQIYPDVKMIFDRIHPNDAPRVQAQILDVLKSSFDGRVSSEYRIIYRDQTIHWLVVHARYHFEEQDGKRRAIFASGTTQDITERKYSEQKLLQRTQQIRLINKATLHLNLSLDSQSVSNVIHDSISQLMPCDRLYISSFDPIGNLITRSSGWQNGQPVDVSDCEAVLLEKESGDAQSQVIRSKQAIYVSDLQTLQNGTRSTSQVKDENHAPNELPQDHPRSTLIAPLLVKGEVFGIIQVFSNQVNAYTEDDLEILNGLSAQAAIALSNARLYENARQENLERQRAEQALQISESKYRALVENIQVGVVVHSKDLGILFSNPKASELLGLSESEMLAKTISNPIWHFIREDGTPMLPEEYPAYQAQFTNQPRANQILGIIRTDRTEPTWVQCNSHATYNHAGQIEQVNVTFIDITERKKAEENIRKRITALELLYESGLAFSQLLNPKDIAQMIIKLLGEKLNWNHSTLRLLREDQSLELIAFDKRDSEDKLSAEARFSRIITKLGEGLSGWALQQSKIILCNDVRKDPHYVESYPNIHSGLYVPLKSGEHALGVISIESEKPNGFNEADQQLISTLANQAAVAFENARLYEEIRRYTEELEERVRERTTEIESTRQRLELAVKTAGIGIWELDIKQNKDFWDDKLFAMYGLSKDSSIACPETWHKSIHPEDLPKQLELMKEAQKNNLPYNTQFRVIWPNNSIHHIKSSGVIVRDASGMPERMIGANQDITIYNQAEETLRLANLEMERALRTKDEFLSTMSHELRTPLNAILGISESLEEQIAGELNQKQIKYVRVINESGHHLLELINDILDLSKIEADKMELNIQPVLVQKLCESSLRMIKELAQKKSLNVSFKLDKNVTIILGDERRLKQSLVNLLGNAVKFTPQGKKIGLEVNGNEQTNKVTFTVWDEGIGINQEDAKLLFKPFVQLNASLAREFSGTGLGLALVAQMIHLHGGHVDLTSELKAGSRFIISLPWRAATQSGQTISPVQNLKDTPSQPADQPKLPHDKHAVKILVVDDTEVAAQLISDYLQHKGYKTEIAHNGSQAVLLAKQEHPHIILMDVMMPVMNGLDATKQIRADPSLKDITIIGLTALAMPNDRQNCIEAGMNDHLSKPIQLPDLIKVIERYLSPQPGL